MEGAKVAVRKFGDDRCKDRVTEVQEESNVAVRKYGDDRCKDRVTEVQEESKGAWEEATGRIGRYVGSRNRLEVRPVITKTGLSRPNSNNRSIALND
jgi:hypothetical protein